MDVPAWQEYGTAAQQYAALTSAILAAWSNVGSLLSDLDKARARYDAAKANAGLVAVITSAGYVEPAGVTSIRTAYSLGAS